MVSKNKPQIPAPVAGPLKGPKGPKKSIDDPVARPVKRIRSIEQTLKMVRRSMSESTIRIQAEKWFEETYVKFDQKPLERNYKRANLELGRMYCFGYFDPKYKKELPFYNIYPISLCVGWIETKSGKRNPLCINITFVPPAIRMKILDKIIQVYHTPIDANRMEVIKGKTGNKIVPTWYHSMKQILKGSGFEFAIRSYIMSRIKTKPLIVTYDEWWKTCVFTTKFVKKMNIRAIYYLYYKNMKPKYKPFEKVQINLQPRKLIK